ncbi:MAG: permease [Candidatus Limnocylindrales bacterium]
MTTLALRRPRPIYWLVVGLAVVAWLVAWFAAFPLASWFAFELLGLEPGTHLGEAVAFFAFDVPKVLLLLLGIVTAVTLIRGFFPPEKVRGALVGRGEFAGTMAAASFGIVTPFCSCSAVPLFIGFVEAGVPLGVTFAFLISSPMVNEVALVLLWGLFGPGIALVYMAAGLTVAIAGGLLIGKLHMERYVEDYVWALQGASNQAIEIRLGWEDRIRDAWAYTRDLVRRILPYIVIGIGIGAVIHGYVPTELVVAIGGPGNPLAVPLVVLLAIPLYSNAAGTIPIVQALLGKGMALGTTLAFMMAITAISLPEFIILKRVIKAPLIALFATIVTIGILFVGYLFNFLIR